MGPNYPRELVLEARDAGVRVEVLVRRRLGADPAHVEKLLRQGRVRLCAAGDAAERVLKSGAELPGTGLLRLLAAPHDRAPPAPNRRIALAILETTADYVVIAKPSGLATHPGPRHGTDTLLNALVARHPEMAALGRERNYGLVHRLDRETSGLLVAARTAAAHQALVAQFRARTVEKSYLAMVLAGERELTGGVATEPVDGKEARTRIEPLERAGPAAPVAWVRLFPETGRKHQIRIHLAARGTPVLADARHGHGLDDLTARLYLKRLALHAERLEFDPPGGGERRRFELPLPRDLKHSWRRAERLFGGAGR